MARPETRQGPRPLAVHLTAASAFYATSIAASLGLRNGSIDWSPTLKAEGESLARAAKRLAEKHPPGTGPRENDPPGSAPPPGSQADIALAQAVETEARGWVGRMLAGVEAYRAHPYRRDPPPPIPIWTEGTTRLLDYRSFGGRAGLKIPLLLIPSLINRAYILDLRESHSLARYLAAKGHAVFLVDWDAPGEIERDFGLDQYIARLRRAVDAVAAETGTPVAAVGYCMGGLLALAGALGVADRVDALVLMATPWDFHVDRPDQAAALAGLLPSLEPLMASTGELPVDVLQGLFAGLDPMMAMRKFARFAETDPDSENARAFVALEDWLNDGVPLSAPVARATIGGWYGRNAPMTGQWRVDGLPVDPGRWTKPTLALIPSDDRIVPPASARALADALPNCRTLTPPAGHIGMVTARGAPRRVWDPLAAFLADL
jgi:polyhydroxyalkanoate synthase